MNIFNKIASPTELLCIQGMLELITTDAAFISSHLCDDSTYIFVEGEIEAPKAVCMTIVTENIDHDSEHRFVNLSVVLVWVAPEFRGTGYSQAFSTDVGYALGRMYAERAEAESELFNQVVLEAYANCNNQGGFNCVHYITDLFAGAFQMFDLDCDLPILRNFQTTFPDPQLPELY